MLHKIIRFSTLSAFLLSMLSVPVRAQTAAVIHASTDEALIWARRNVRNLLMAEPEAETELVANASVVSTVPASSDPAESHLVLCRNSLENMSLSTPKGMGDS